MRVAAANGARLDVDVRGLLTEDRSGPGDPGWEPSLVRSSPADHGCVGVLGDGVIAVHASPEDRAEHHDTDRGHGDDPRFLRTAANTFQTLFGR